MITLDFRPKYSFKTELRCQAALEPEQRFCAAEELASSI